jgi:hypothetical protein
LCAINSICHSSAVPLDHQALAISCPPTA